MNPEASCRDGIPDATLSTRISRSRALKANIAVGVAGRAVNAAIALFTVPILLAALGPTRYGVYATATAIAGWAQLGTLGIGKGLMNALVECRARADEQEARRYVGSLWGALLAGLAAISLPALCVMPLLDWRRILPGSEASRPELTATMEFTVLFSIIALALSPVATILSAYQDERKATLWGVVRNAANLAALASVYLMRGGMPAIALTTGIAAAGTGGASVAWLFLWDKPFLRPRRRDVSLQHVWRVLGSSTSFFAIDIAALIVFQLDKVLIIQFVGPSSVTEFDVASRVYLVGYSVFALVLNPLWPAFGDAVRRGDVQWAERLLSRVSKGATLAMAGAVGILILAGRWLIPLWTRRDDIVPSRLLLFLVGTYFIARVWTDVHTIVVFSMDRQRQMLLLVLVQAALTLSMGLLFAATWGVLGVALANLLAFSLTAGWWVPWKARSMLRAPRETRWIP